MIPRQDSPRTAHDPATSITSIRPPPRQTIPRHECLTHDKTSTLKTPDRTLKTPDHSRLTLRLWQVLLESIVAEIISEQLIHHRQGTPILPPNLPPALSIKRSTPAAKVLARRLRKDVQNVGPDLLVRPYVPLPSQ